MPKQIIVIMQDSYPFGECEQRTTEKTKVLVRKIYQVSVQQRNKLLEKVNILRKLRNQNMIKIESVLEEQESVHFLFQYIPIKLQTWISNINDQFIENFRDQLIKFSSFLANNYIKIEFQLKNIGMDQNYGAKYFLDLNFTVDTNINREKLKSAYIREITNLFKPYIMSNPAASIVSDSQRSVNANEFKSAKQIPKKNEEPSKGYDASVSPPTNKASASKNKEKALAQYYQQVNMSVDSENQKILQEFMDVLDNEDQEVGKKHPPAKQPTPQKPQQNTFQRQPSSQNVPATFQASNVINTPPPQFHSQDNLSNFRSAQLPQNTSMSQSTGRRNSNQKPQIYRESVDLQNRVKSAIEKSLSVIKKFKAIKENL